jgi:hypothetical protein
MKRLIVLLICVCAAGVTSFAGDNKEVAQKIRSAFQSEAFHLSGFGQIAAAYSEYPGRGLASPETNSSFDIVVARLTGSGKFGSRRQFGYLLMYDFGYNAKLQELYGEWLPSDAVNLRLGQYSIPFTIENQISPSGIETVYTSRAVDAMAGSSGDFNQYDPNGIKGNGKSGRDVGLQVSGQLFRKNDFYHVEYLTGIFNGAGANTRDNNTQKDFIGTVYYRPVKDLKVGGSIYKGTLNTPINDKPGNHAREFWAVSAEYNSKHLYARTEYIAGKNGALERNGYYGSAVWKFVPNKWEGVVKYEVYDADRAISDNEVSDITAGFNYYLAHLTYIQLNYIYTCDKINGSNSAVAMQLQLYF